MNAPANLTDAAFRASVVGASEIAALFDASPWLTRFELWHRKNGTIATPDFNAVTDGTPENERVYFGVMLEPVVIAAACERWSYVPQPTPVRLDNGKGLGGHPDKIVTCPSRGPGILEVKTADWLVAKKWGEEPPLHYLLQAQTYAGLAKIGWADVIVLVGGNELRRFQYDFRPELFEKIEARVEAFWTDVHAGIVPKPDFERDGATIVATIGQPDDTFADLRSDLGAEDAAMRFVAAKADIRVAEARAESAKNELLLKIGAASSALLPSFRVGCAMTKGNPGTVVTEAHIGQVINKRTGWRRFDVKEIA